MSDGSGSGRAEGLIECAAQASGLEPRGLDTLLPGLARFCEAYDRESTPTLDGRRTTDALILEVLRARFAIEDWIANRPEVLQAPVKRPVFILGLPRAGTTALFNLLGHDPQRRFYWSWENNREVPPALAAHKTTDPRIARKKAEIEAALEAGLLDHRQHVEMGDQPAECIMLMAQDFKSYLWLARGLVPSYFEWMLHEADMDAAYRHHRRALQVMQSGMPGKWTLKLPNHAQAIDAILRVYPDARIVVTHRDPVKSVGSSCDAELFFLNQCNEGIDKAALGQRTLALLATEMDRIDCARTGREASFHDFHFRDFIDDRVGEVRRLYAFLGDDLSPEVELAMRGELSDAETLRKEVGRHEYDLADFGLSTATVRDAFGDYMDRNRVTPEA